MAGMRRSRLLAPALAPLLAATLFLGACNSDDDSDKKSDDNSSSASESAGDTGSDTASDSASDSASDTGDDSAATGNTATAPKAGVKFDLPEGWQAIDPANVSANAEAPKLAEKLGITVEQFEQQLKALDLFAQNDSGENLNVVSGTVPALPSADEIKQQYQTGLGFTVSSTEDVSTPVGDGIRLEWDLPENSTSNTAGAGVFVDVDGTVVNISVTASSAESAAKVLDTVLATITTA